MAGRSDLQRTEIIALRHPGAVTAGDPGRGPGQGPVLVPAPVHDRDLAPPKGDQGQHLALRVDHPQGPLCQFRDILARPLQEHQGKLLQMKSPMRVMNDPLIINSNCLHVFFSFITTVHLNLTPNVLSKLWLDYSNITHFLLVGLFSYT